MSTADTQILLLDDEAAVCEVMRAHLDTLGFTCQIDVSPTRALERLRQNTFGLLITDLRMPELGGLEVVQRAKEIDPDMAIVVVTAMMDIANAIDAMHAGADDYVVKPFNLGEIGRAATRALEATIGAVKTTLRKGGTVSLVGFGTFAVGKRAARSGRNPRTGTAIKIKAAKVPKFRPGKALKDALN
mgnify:CR=1 FL=1